MCRHFSQDPSYKILLTDMVNYYLRDVLYYRKVYGSEKFGLKQPLLVNQPKKREKEKEQERESLA